MNHSRKLLTFLPDTSACRKLHILLDRGVHAKIEGVIMKVKIVRE
jgi:hypothetical protein